MANSWGNNGHSERIYLGGSKLRNTGLEETQAGIKISGEISITSDMKMTPPLRQKRKKN